VTGNVAEGATSHSAGVSAHEMTIAYSTIAGNSAAVEANVSFYPYPEARTSTVLSVRHRRSSRRR
jgi:hypothetical protein